VKWVSALANSARLEDAVEEATESLQADMGRDASIDLVFAFVTQHHADHFEKLPDAILTRLGGASELVGCSAQGVLAGGVEVEQEPGLVLVGAHLPEVKVTPFYLPPDPREWSEALLVREAEPDFVVLSDPHSSSAEDLVRWFDEAYPESTKIGGLVSGSDQPGESILYALGTSYRMGSVGVALSGNLEVDTVVAQGCRPIGNPLFVTRGDHHVIYELDGRPATEVLERLHAELSPADQQLFLNSLFVGVVMREHEQIYQQGDFLIRPLIGIDPQAKALAAAAVIHQGSVVQFHLRDARTSADDLEEMLSRHQYAQPAGALLFSCVGRGRDLYGEPHHDSRRFHHQMGRVPLGGFFASGEIGPVRGQTYVHGYTSSFGLFRRKNLM
jgi:small ligand-binding sensory domain FIST